MDRVLTRTGEKQVCPNGSSASKDKSEAKLACPSSAHVRTTPPTRRKPLASTCSSNVTSQPVCRPSRSQSPRRSGDSKRPAQSASQEPARPSAWELHQRGLIRAVAGPKDVFRPERSWVSTIVRAGQVLHCLEQLGLNWKVGQLSATESTLQSELPVASGTMGTSVAVVLLRPNVAAATVCCLGRFKTQESECLREDDLPVVPAKTASQGLCDFKWQREQARLIEASQTRANLGESLELPPSVETGQHTRPSLQNSGQHAALHVGSVSISHHQPARKPVDCRSQV